KKKGMPELGRAEEMDLRRRGGNLRREFESRIGLIPRGEAEERQVVAEIEGLDVGGELLARGEEDLHFSVAAPESVGGGDDAALGIGDPSRRAQAAVEEDFRARGGDAVVEGWGGDCLEG